MSTSKLNYKKYSLGLIIFVAGSLLAPDEPAAPIQAQAAETTGPIIAPGNALELSIQTQVAPVNESLKSAKNSEQGPSPAVAAPAKVTIASAQDCKRLLEAFAKSLTGDSGPFFNDDLSIIPEKKRFFIISPALKGNAVQRAKGAKNLFEKFGDDILNELVQVKDVNEEMVVNFIAATDLLIGLLQGNLLEAISDLKKLTDATQIKDFLVKEVVGKVKDMHGDDDLRRELKAEILAVADIEAAELLADAAGADTVKIGDTVKAGFRLKKKEIMTRSGRVPRYGENKKFFGPEIFDALNAIQKSMAEQPKVVAAPVVEAPKPVDPYESLGKEDVFAKTILAADTLFDSADSQAKYEQIVQKLAARHKADIAAEKVTVEEQKSLITKVARWKTVFTAKRTLRQPALADDFADFKYLSEQIELTNNLIEKAWQKLPQDPAKNKSMGKVVLGLVFKDGKLESVATLSKVLADLKTFVAKDPAAQNLEVKNTEMEQLVLFAGESDSLPALLKVLQDFKASLGTGFLRKNLPDNGESDLDKLIALATPKTEAPKVVDLLEGFGSEATFALTLEAAKTKFAIVNNQDLLNRFMQKVVTKYNTDLAAQKVNDAEKASLVAAYKNWSKKIDAMEMLGQVIVATEKQDSQLEKDLAVLAGIEKALNPEPVDKRSELEKSVDDLLDLKGKASLAVYLNSNYGETGTPDEALLNGFVDKLKVVALAEPAATIDVMLINPKLKQQAALRERVRAGLESVLVAKDYAGKIIENTAVVPALNNEKVKETLKLLRAIFEIVDGSLPEIILDLTKNNKSFPPSQEVMTSLLNKIKVQLDARKITQADKEPNKSLIQNIIDRINEAKTYYNVDGDLPKSIKDRLSLLVNPVVELSEPSPVEFQPAPAPEPIKFSPMLEMFEMLVKAQQDLDRVKFVPANYAGLDKEAIRQAKTEATRAENEIRKDVGSKLKAMIDAERKNNRAIQSQFLSNLDPDQKSIFAKLMKAASDAAK